MSAATDRLKRIEAGIRSTEAFLNELRAEKRATLKEVEADAAKEVDGRHRWQPAPYQKVAFKKTMGGKVYTYLAVFSIARWFVTQDGSGPGRMRSLRHSEFIDFVGKENEIDILVQIRRVLHHSTQGYTLRNIEDEF